MLFIYLLQHIGSASNTYFNETNNFSPTLPFTSESKRGGSNLTEYFALQYVLIAFAIFAFLFAIITFVVWIYKKRHFVNPEIQDIEEFMLSGNYDNADLSNQATPKSNNHIFL